MYLQEYNIELHYIQICQKKYQQPLSQIIDELKKILITKIFNLSNKYLGEKNIKNSMKVFNQQFDLLELNLEGNCLTDKFLPFLIKCFRQKYLHGLICLYLGDNYFKDAELFAQFLNQINISSNKIQKLSLKGIKFKKTDVSSTLSQFQCLQYLDVKNCGLLHFNLQSLKNLNFINLKNNQLNTNIFLQLIENQSNLEEIRLDNSFKFQTSLDIVKNDNNIKILKIKRSELLINHFIDNNSDCKQLVLTLSKLHTLIISKNSNLQQLLNKIRNQMILLVNYGQKPNFMIKNFILSHSPMNDQQSFQILIHFIKNLINLETIYINDCSLNIQQVNQLQIQKLLILFQIEIVYSQYSILLY